MSIIFPYPALHSNTLDYRNPQAYMPKATRSNTKITIDHSIRSDNLVGRLILKKMAVFCATVSVRGSIYRRTEMALEKIECTEDNISCRQIVEIPDFKNDLPIFLNCGVVTIGEIKGSQTSKTDDADDADGPDDSSGAESVDDPAFQFNSHIGTFKIPYKGIGLSEFFLEGQIRFPDKALIAHNDWARFFSLESLFVIESSSRKFSNDRMFSAQISYSPNLKIRIEMQPELYNEIQSNKHSPARAHVICASLVKMLEELHATYKKAQEQDDEGADSDWLQMLEEAEGLKTFLETRNPPIPTWDASDFDAVYSASAYKPVPRLAERVTTE